MKNLTRGFERFLKSCGFFADDMRVQVERKGMRDEGQRFGWMSGILGGTGVEL